MSKQELMQDTEKRTGLTTPATLLQMAVEQNADIDKLEKLMNLQTRWEESEAKKAYVMAMGRFRDDCPVIEKTRPGHNSKYAGLAETLESIRISMTEHFLSHSWHTDQKEGLVSVTCTVMHKQGHSESTTLSALPDGSGNKNAIQAVGSTVTYLQRYTLFAILGLASIEQDDDGKNASQPLKITDDQVNEIDALINENGMDMTRFLRWLAGSTKAKSIADINVVALPAVLQFIKQTINKHGVKK